VLQDISRLRAEILFSVPGPRGPLPLPLKTGAPELRLTGHGIRCILPSGIAVLVPRRGAGFDMRLS